MKNQFQQLGQYYTNVKLDREITDHSVKSDRGNYTPVSICNN